MIRKCILCCFLFIGAFIIRYSLVNDNHDHVYEHDVGALVTMTEQIYVLVNDRVSNENNYIWRLSPYQTYLDGNLVLTTITCVIIEKLNHLGVVNLPAEYTNTYLVILSNKLTNTTLYALSIVLAFLIVLRLLNSVWYSFMFVVALILFNGLSFLTNILRIDHYLVFTCLLCLWLGMLLLENRTNYKLALFLGVAFVMNLATKLTTPLTFTLPFVLTMTWLLRKDISQRLITYFATGVLISIPLFFFRWLISIQNIPNFIETVYFEGRGWIDFFDSNYFYYPVLVFLEVFYTAITKSPLNLPSVTFVIVFFITLSYCILVWLLLVFLIYKRIKLQNVGLLIIAVFAWHMIGAFRAPSVARYAMMFPYYYLFIISMGFWMLGEIDISQKIRKNIKFGMLVIVFCYGCLQVLGFGLSLNNLSYSKQSFIITRLDSKEWIEQNIPHGNRIAVYSGANTYPYIFSGDWYFNDSILGIPMAYESPSKHLGFLPLTKDQLETQTDYLILNDNGYDFHLAVLKSSKTRSDFTDLSDTEDSSMIIYLLDEMWRGKHLSEAMTTISGIADTLEYRRILNKWNIPDKQSITGIGYSQFIDHFEGAATNLAWRQFYNSIDRDYLIKTFESDYSNYGVSQIKIYNASSRDSTSTSNTTVSTAD